MTQDLGRVSELWRYPASSFAGESRAAIAVGSGGVEGDRLYGIVDLAGEIAKPATGPKWQGVPRIRTRLGADGAFEIAAPGSGWIAAPGGEADRAVSDFLGFGASIRPLAGEPAETPGSPTATARYVKAPVHLLTTASLARLQALHPAGQPDTRRFRPNIVVEIPEVEGHFPETEWIGRKIAVGALEMTIAEPCRRCGFTILAQEGIDNDPDILRTLVRQNAHNLGVYCTVDRPAEIALGDPMRML